MSLVSARRPRTPAPSPVAAATGTPRTSAMWSSRGATGPSPAASSSARTSPGSTGTSGRWRGRRSSSARASGRAPSVVHSWCTSSHYSTGVHFGARHRRPKCRRHPPIARQSKSHRQGPARRHFSLSSNHERLHEARSPPPLVVLVFDTRNRNPFLFCKPSSGVS